MIHRTTSHTSLLLAMAAGLVVAGGAPVKADFFKDVERAFVGTYEDARDGAKGVAKDASRAISGPQSNQPVTYVTGTANGGAASAPVAGNLTADVQSELTQAGYNPGPADGINGPRTTQAVREYQAANGLPQDGQVTQSLLDNLRSKRLAAYNTTTGQPPAPVAPSGYAPAPAPGPVQPANPMQQQSPPPAPAPVAAPPASPVVQHTQPAQPQSGLPQLPGAAPPQQPMAQQAQQGQGQQTCKPYEKRTMIDGRQTVTTGTACLQADGTWKPIN